MEFGEIVLVFFCLKDFDVEIDFLIGGLKKAEDAVFNAFDLNDRDAEVFSRIREVYQRYHIAELRGYKVQKYLD